MQPKPSASLVLFTYNQEATVVPAAKSCLAQIGDPIEIIFSDDASTDSTFDLLRDIAEKYDGPHTLVLRRNSTNLGIGQHYSTVVQMASSELIVVAAGDDISAPNRVQRLVETWLESERRLYLIASYAQQINLLGQPLKLVKTSQLSAWTDAKQWCAKRPYVVGATYAFTKRLFEHFGPIASGVNYEDQVLSLRACTLGKATTIEEPLIQYRVGGFSARQHTASCELLANATKKYSSQLATYTQITQDLNHVGEPELAQQMARKYVERSQACLSMLAASGAKGLYSLYVFGRQCGPNLNPFWVFFKSLLIKYPKVAFWLLKSI